MKLYEIPRNSKILLPISHQGKEPKMEMCKFKYVDGMYSYIVIQDRSIVHLGASSLVKKVKNHYELI